MSPKKPEEPVPFKIFDYGTIKEPMHGLQFNVERDLKKRSKETTDEKTAGAYILMRVAVLFMKHLYNSIIFLVADEEAKGRHDEYIVSVPSICRTMQEILFTVMYLGEDFPNRADQYYKASWREHNEERGKYCNEYSTDPEWAPFLKTMKRGLTDGVQYLKLSEEESKNPQREIAYVPIGMRLLESLSKENQPFAKWLDKWFYQEVSAIAHFTPLGTVKIGAFLIKDVIPEATPNKIAETLRSFKGFHSMMATFVVLCTASELEHLFKLNNRDQIAKIWDKLRVVFTDAEEICTRRYDKLLNMTRPQESRAKNPI